MVLPYIYIYALLLLLQVRNTCMLIEEIESAVPNEVQEIQVQNSNHILLEVPHQIISSEAMV